MERLEKEVGEHVAYNDACNAFNTWLRAAREKLATCSDTYGDQPAIEGKLKKVEKLEERMDEGEKKLNNAVELSETILHHTSPAGHPRVETDAHNMKQDFTDLQVKLLFNLEPYLISRRLKICFDHSIIIDPFIAHCRLSWKVEDSH